MTNWSEVGSIMTGVGSGAIAWQAWLTRRLVKATKDDLATGRKVVLEAAKSRLDARGPMVMIGTTETLQVPLAGSPHGEPQPLSGSLSLPQSLPILVQVDLEVNNTESGTVHLTTPPGMVAVPPTSEVSYRDRPLRETYHAVRPKQFVYFRWWGEMAFEDWLENCDRLRSKPQFANEAFCEITVSDVLDEGVLDCWRVSVSGAPFFADKATEGLWHVVLGSTQGETFRSGAVHTERVYYQSRRRGVTLEDAILSG